MSATKLPSLNGLRAISIIIVILHHLKIKGYLPQTNEFTLVTPLRMLIEDGQFGVNIFFVISGFLITSLLIREELETRTVSLYNFYIRRTLRIFPAYFLYLLVLFALHLGGVIEISKISWFTAITYTKYFNHSLDWFTGHAWSLSIEEQFYLFWPFIFMLGIRARNWVVLIFIFVVPLIRIYTHLNPTSWIDDLSFFTRIDAIAVGCLCAMYRDQLLSVKKSFWTPIFFCAIAGLYFLQLCFAYNGHLGIDMYIVTLGLTLGSFANIFIAIIMMYSVFGPHNFWFKMLNTKLLNYIGLLSYSLYLWQQLFFSNSISTITTFPYNIIYFLAVAMISYYFVEKPFIKLKTKFQRINITNAKGLKQ